MTWFELYALVGVPAILLVLAYAAFRMVDRDARHFDEAQARRARQPGK
jgi:hypothetical protein